MIRLVGLFHTRQKVYASPLHQLVANRLTNPQLVRVTVVPGIADGAQEPAQHRTSRRVGVKSEDSMRRLAESPFLAEVICHAAANQTVRGVLAW